MSDPTANPQYSLQRFIEFLDYRGVSRVPWKEEKANSNQGHIGTSSRPLLAWSNSRTERYDELDNLGTSENPYPSGSGLSLLRARRTILQDVGTIPNNPDLYYLKPATAVLTNNEVEDDMNFKYVGSNLASDRRFSNNSDRKHQRLFKELERHSLVVQDNLQTWEHHDTLTAQETYIDHQEEAAEVFEDNEIHNGGLYDPFRAELSEISSRNSSNLLCLAPAAKFRDGIDLAFVGATRLCGLEASRRYKNNLSTIIIDDVEGDLLITGCRSEILVFEFEHQRHLPKKWPGLKFDTRPPFTSTADRIVLTWPYFPHTINYMASYNNWNHGAILGVCTDDGSVLLWNHSTLKNELQNTRSGQNSYVTDTPPSTRLRPDISLKVKSSAWGLDFACAYDTFGRSHHIVIASSNSQTVTLFYLGDGAKTFGHVSSHQLLHNIPAISVMDYLIADNVHQATISCGSISGELAIFLFKFSVDIDTPQRSEGLSWPLRVNQVQFDEPTVVKRTFLGLECWTTKPIRTGFFKPVQSMRAMIGDPFIDERAEASHIITESQILGDSFDTNKLASFGIATNWQFFEAPVVCLLASESFTHESNDTSKFTKTDEEYRRIHQAYKHVCLHEKSSTQMFSDTIVAISTNSRLGLFRADTLFCVSATKDVFELEIPVSDETKWCKRILITHILEELLCLIAVSQMGLVTIMRLCEYRGLLGMRQEHLFPNPLGLTIADSSLRSITGLSVRNMSATLQYPRFYLYILYSDGLVLTYELCEKMSVDCEIDI